MSLLRQPGWLRALEVTAGVLTILLAFVVFAFPGLGVASLVVILAVGLIFLGIRSFFVAGYHRLSPSLRALSVMSGILVLIFAVLVIVLPGYGTLSLVVLLSLGLMLYGFSRMYLAYSLKWRSSGFRAAIATLGVLVVALSAIAVAEPGLALLTLVVVLGVAMLFCGVEEIVFGVDGRTWLGDVVKSAEDDVAV